MRKIPALARGFPGRTILRVLPLAELASQWEPGIQFLVEISSQSDLAIYIRLVKSGLINLGVLTDDPCIANDDRLRTVICTQEKLQSGDVIAVSDGKQFAHVLFRESDVHHTIFLTNRCNSSCLMCSQPPTTHDDSWLVDEAHSISGHMRISPPIVGFTGGEPLLLGSGFRLVLDQFMQRHPNTEFDVLTNGRLLADCELAAELLADLPGRVTWMVPLYGHADVLHDFVVQSPGAFEQTIKGLLTLQKYEQAIQLRVVLIKPVLEMLPELCEFIGKNLPFVQEVALMGCEPIGFALANRTLCEVDLKQWQHELTDGVTWLNRFMIKPIIMNVPLCALPSALWLYAHQSISDWKQVFSDECEHCTVRTKCSGLFSWYDRGWMPTSIRAITRN